MLMKNGAMIPKSSPVLAALEMAGFFHRKQVTTVAQMANARIFSPRRGGIEFFIFHPESAYTKYSLKTNLTMTGWQRIFASCWARGFGGCGKTSVGDRLILRSTQEFMKCIYLI
jgi:hypothetical protein